MPDVIVVSIPDFLPAIMAAGIPVAGMLLVLWLQQRARRRQRYREYVGVWGTVLVQLAYALDRIHYTEGEFAKTPSSLPLYEIYIQEPLLSAFLAQNIIPDVGSKTYWIYYNVLQFKRCADMATRFNDEAEAYAAAHQSEKMQYPERKRDNWISGALWLASNRHEKMVSEFNWCVNKYVAFCKKWRIKSDLDLIDRRLLPEERRQTEGEPPPEIIKGAVAWESVNATRTTS